MPVQTFIMGRTSQHSGKGKHGSKSSRQPQGMGPVRLVSGKHIDGQPLKLMVQVRSIALQPRVSNRQSCLIIQGRLCCSLPSP